MRLFTCADGALESEPWETTELAPNQPTEHNTRVSAREALANASQGGPGIRKFGICQNCELLSGYVEDAAHSKAYVCVCRENTVSSKAHGTSGVYSLSIRSHG